MKTLDLINLDERMKNKMEENGINIKDDIVEKIVKVLNILKEKNPKGVDVG